jgi:hypothetical protein
MSPQAQKREFALVCLQAGICKFTHLQKYIEYVDVMTMKTIKEYNLIYVCQ